jgi:hypothetical protein
LLLFLLLLLLLSFQPIFQVGYFFAVWFIYFYHISDNIIASILYSIEERRKKKKLNNSFKILNSVKQD